MFNKIQSLIVRDIFVSSSPFLVSLPFTISGLAKFSETEEKALWQPPGYVFGIVWPIIYLSLFKFNFSLLNNKQISNNIKNVIINDTLIESFLQGLWLYNFRYKKEINGRTRKQYYVSSLNIFFLVLFGMTRILKFFVYNDEQMLIYLLMYIPYFSWINFANILNLQLLFGIVK